MADGAAYRLQDSLQVPFADVPEPAWAAVGLDTTGCVGRTVEPRPRDKRPYGLRPIKGVDDAVLAKMTSEELLGLRDKVDGYIRAHEFRKTRIPADVRRIINIAAEAAGVLVLDLVSRRRSGPIAAARKRAMASAYALTDDDGTRRFSSTRVGDFFRRDYSTVWHAVQTVPDEELIRL